MPPSVPVRAISAGVGPSIACPLMYYLSCVSLRVLAGCDGGARLFCCLGGFLGEQFIDLDLKGPEASVGSFRTPIPSLLRSALLMLELSTLTPSSRQRRASSRWVMPLRRRAWRRGRPVDDLALLRRHDHSLVRSTAGSNRKPASGW